MKIGKLVFYKKKLVFFNTFLSLPIQNQLVIIGNKFILYLLDIYTFCNYQLVLINFISNT